MLIAMTFAEYLRHKVNNFYKHHINCSYFLFDATSLGDDGGCDYCSDVCNDSAESAISLSQPLLGGIHPFLHHTPPAQRQRGRGWIPH